MNRITCRVGVVLLIVALLPSFASACLWDWDTLKQERARFPDALEIITGKFLRHSKEFYEWRIQDRLKKIAADRTNPAHYNDLAVAYEKTGQNAKAIETMLKVESFAPGLYETYSNLGTFYFLGGDFKKGLEYVDKALAINPDAHFGREKYQKYLTEYVIERSKDGKIVLPLSRSKDDKQSGIGIRQTLYGRAARAGRDRSRRQDARWTRKRAVSNGYCSRHGDHRPVGGHFADADRQDGESQTAIALDQLQPLTSPLIPLR